MLLELPTNHFVAETLSQHKKDGHDDLNVALSRLFTEFNDHTNKSEVLIKVAALNKIYSTAILNIDPVVERIQEVITKQKQSLSLDEYVHIVDEIALVEWVSKAGKTIKRKNFLLPLNTFIF